MANFVNKITEVQYNSISDFIQHYLEDVREGYYITIYADSKNTQKLLPYLIQYGDPVDIEYGTPDMTGYDKEYSLAILNFDNKNDEFFVNFAYDNERKRYFGDIDADDAVIFIGDINDELLKLAIEDAKQIVRVSF